MLEPPRAEAVALVQHELRKNSTLRREDPISALCQEPFDVDQLAVAETIFINSQTMLMEASS